MADILLTGSEEEIMQFLWTYNEPVTRNDLKELCTERTWKDNYLSSLLLSLEKKNMIKAVGMIRCGKTYARRFTYSITREEYIAKLVVSKGINLNTIKEVAAAMINNEKDSHEKTDEEKKTIKEIEEIIQEMKNSGGE